MRNTWIRFLPVLLMVAPLAQATEEAATRQAAGGTGRSGLLGVLLAVATLAAIAFLAWLARWYLIRRKMVAKNDPRKAAEHYDQFVSLWKNADPELQPRVAEVRARVAKLRSAERR